MTISWLRCFQSVQQLFNSTTLDVELEKRDDKAETSILEYVSKSPQLPTYAELVKACEIVAYYRLKRFSQGESKQVSKLEQCGLYFPVLLVGVIAIPLYYIPLCLLKSLSMIQTDIFAAMSIIVFSILAAIAGVRREEIENCDIDDTTLSIIATCWGIASSAVMSYRARFARMIIFAPRIFVWWFACLFRKFENSFERRMYIAAKSDQVLTLEEELQFRTRREVIRRHIIDIYTCCIVRDFVVSSGIFSPALSSFYDEIDREKWIPYVSEFRDLKPAAVLRTNLCLEHPCRKAARLLLLPHLEKLAPALQSPDHAMRIISWIGDEMLSLAAIVANIESLMMPPRRRRSA